MAKPDCDDGWLKYAHELDAALAVADFSKGARIVLHEVFSQIFSLAKLRTARISPSELARRSGQVREVISRAVKELVDSNVLSPQSDGSYRFNKHYESWTGCNRHGSTETPRLSPVEIGYCGNAPAIAKAFQHGYSPKSRSQTATVGDPKCSQLATGTVAKRLRNRSQRATETVANGLRAEPSPYRNGREEEFKRVGVLNSNNDDVDDEERGYPIRNAEHRLTVEHARAAFGDRFALVIAQQGRDIEMSTGGRWDCFRAAIDTAKRSKKGIDDLYPWCRKLAAGYAIDGLPLDPVSSTPARLTVAERAEIARKNIGFPSSERK